MTQNNWLIAATYDEHTRMGHPDLADFVFAHSLEEAEKLANELHVQGATALTIAAIAATTMPGADTHTELKNYAIELKFSEPIDCDTCDEPFSSDNPGRSEMFWDM